MRRARPFLDTLRFWTVVVSVACVPCLSMRMLVYFGALHAAICRNLMPTADDMLKLVDVIMVNRGHHA